VSEMVDVMLANNLKQGEKVWAKTNIHSPNGKTSVYPDKTGCILCEGKLVGPGLGMKWDSLFIVEYCDPISKKQRSLSFSDEEKGYEGCFFVERKK